MKETLLDLFKNLTEEEKIEFINLLIDVINDCNSTHKPSNEYTIIAKYPHIYKEKTAKEI